MAKSSVTPAEDGPGWVKKMRRVVISGGPLRGARYGDIPESEVARWSKSYKGDARFGQYCKQFMASKLIEGVQAPAGERLSTDASEQHTTFDKWKQCRAFFSKYMNKWPRSRVFLACLVCLFILSRPRFTILCGRLSMLMVKTVFRQSLALLTAVLDAILEETIHQVDSVLMPMQIGTEFSPTAAGHADKSPGTYQLATHLVCVVVGAIYGRRGMPLLARNP